MTCKLPNSIISIHVCELGDMRNIHNHCPLLMITGQKGPRVLVQIRNEAHGFIFSTSAFGFL